MGDIHSSVMTTYFQNIRILSNITSTRQIGNFNISIYLLGMAFTINNYTNQLEVLRTCPYIGQMLRLPQFRVCVVSLTASLHPPEGARIDCSMATCQYQPIILKHLLY